MLRVAFFDNFSRIFREEGAEEAFYPLFYRILEIIYYLCPNTVIRNPLRKV